MNRFQAYCLLSLACTLSTLGYPQASAAAAAQTYTLSTKIYLNTDGSVNLPKYHGYGLLYEDDRHIIEISGTLYSSKETAFVPKSLEAIAVRIWEKNKGGGIPRLNTLCCAPGLNPESVSVIQWDDQLQILDFSSPSGERLYREVRQTPDVGTSIKVTLGYDVAPEQGQLRAIAISADQEVSQAAFTASLCKQRSDANLKRPDLSSLKESVPSGLGVLGILEKAC